MIGGRNITGAFHPLIKISVSKRRSFKRTLLESCGDSKILYHMKNLRILKKGADKFNRLLRTGIISFLP